MASIGRPTSGPAVVRRTRAGRADPTDHGLTVLLYQAGAQVELMTGRPGPVEAMRTALVAAVAAWQG